MFGAPLFPSLLLLLLLDSAMVAADNRCIFRADDDNNGGRRRISAGSLDSVESEDDYYYCYTARFDVAVNEDSREDCTLGLVSAETRLTAANGSLSEEEVYNRKNCQQQACSEGCSGWYFTRGGGLANLVYASRVS